MTAAPIPSPGNFFKLLELGANSLALFDYDALKAQKLRNLRGGVLSCTNSSFIDRRAAVQ
jgi:hypothetical protein